MFLRNNELEVLEKSYGRDKADLIVIYGRRRLGKTTLVLRFLEGKKGVYLYTPRGKLEDILSLYMEALKKQLGLEFVGEITKFSEFLEILKKVSKKEKIVIVLDEFQRIHEADESAISILQDYWDRELRKTKVKLILVGSVISIVERLALAGDAPLFDRITNRVKLEPLPYYRSRKYWRHLDPEERVIAYGVFGGTPSYIDSFDFNKSIWKNIEELIVRKEGRLNNEPETLLASELKTTTVYMSILDRIAQGERGLPLGKIKVGNYNVIPYINRLEKMDILERLKPLGENKKGAMYAFKDEFFRFWFKFIRRNYWLIEMDRYDLVMEKIMSDINKYLSYTFEKILRELLVLSSGKKLNGVEIPIFEKFGPYWEKNLEIDALGISKQSIVVGEAKWQDKKIGFKDISKVIEKAKFLADKFGKKNYIVIVASKEGFVRNYEEENIVLLDIKTIEKLFDNLTNEK